MITYSGWPSPTDSEVKRKVDSAGVPFVPFEMAIVAVEKGRGWISSTGEAMQSLWGKCERGRVKWTKRALSTTLVSRVQIPRVARGIHERSYGGEF